MAIAYFQPVTRGEISEMFGREISSDLIGSLRVTGLIAAGPRSPQPGAPYAYVTTRACATCRISRSSKMRDCWKRGVPRVSARLRT
jgi:hypothetical protein